MPNKSLLQNTFFELLKEIKPQKLVREQCKKEGDILTIQRDEFDLSKYKNIYLLGSGKVVIPMTKALQEVLGDVLTKTLIVGAYDNYEELDKVTYIKSTHPLPSTKSIESAKALLNTIHSFSEDDFFIYLLSGGTSSLVELPEEEITLEDMQETTSVMIKGAMPIEAINSVRKHISRVKGGKLVKDTKADGIVLVFSDVIGDDLHTIGSAPLYYDDTSFKDALKNLEHFHLLDKIPQRVKNYLYEGKEGLKPETPKAQNENIKHYILASNVTVLKKAKELLESQGLKATIIEEQIEGDVEDVARQMIAFAKEHQDNNGCYIFGGESTVKVLGDGKGGRNQHLVLKVLDLLDGDLNITFLSAATDGIDGNSEAAGAIIDTHSLVNTKVSHIDWKHYLETFDSNCFFQRTSELLVSGPTHNNLLDIVIMVVEPRIKGEN